MAVRNSSLENEIKLRIRGAEDGRALLARAGFHPATPRLLETNVIFDTPDGRLRGAGTLLRVRECGGRALVTYKGVAEPGPHKTREEIEFVPDSAPACSLVLTRLGFVPAFRYEKYRTEYRTDAGEGIAMLDETPIGDFLELEGNAAWIDRIAAALGFAPREYITASYARLYREYRDTHPATAEDMVFPAP